MLQSLAMVSRKDAEYQLNVLSLVERYKMMHMSLLDHIPLTTLKFGNFSSDMVINIVLVSFGAVY